MTALYQAGFDESIAALGRECALGAVTRSEKGAVVVEKGEIITVAAHPIKELVDANGAGDAFAAGFLHGWTQGLGSRRSAELGAFAAGQVIQKMGPRNDIDLGAAARAAGLL